MSSRPLKMHALSSCDTAAILAIINAYPELHWNEGKLCDTLASASCRAFGLRDQGHLISFCLFQIAQHEAELLLVATQPEALGRGHAADLLHQAFSTLHAAQVTDVFLEVRASNAHAMTLYQRCGFELIHIRKNYYDTPKGREDAQVMKLHLPHD